MNKKPISLQGFESWFSEQKDMKDFFNMNRNVEDPNDKYIGNHCRSKVSEQKLLQKIETEDEHESEVLIEEFLKEGGTVLVIEGKRIQIEVESGTFSVPLFCVKVRKE